MSCEDEFGLRRLVMLSRRASTIALASLVAVGLTGFHWWNSIGSPPKLVSQASRARIVVSFPSTKLEKIPRGVAEALENKVDDAAPGLWNGVRQELESRGVGSIVGSGVRFTKEGGAIWSFEVSVAEAEVERRFFELAAILKSSGAPTLCELEVIVREEAGKSHLGDVVTD